MWHNKWINKLLSSFVKQRSFKLSVTPRSLRVCATDRREQGTCVTKRIVTWPKMSSIVVYSWHLRCWHAGQCGPTSWSGQSTSCRGWTWCPWRARTLCHWWLRSPTGSWVPEPTGPRSCCWWTRSCTATACWPQRGCWGCRMRSWNRKDVVTWIIFVYSNWNEREWGTLMASLQELK